MSDQTFQLTAIAVYLAAMLAIGYFAFRRTKNIEDYMLADRGLPPAVAALSAGASDMSGWLLMGLPGSIYVSGLIEAWIAIGLTIGAWLNWKFVAPRLRSYTEVAENAITIPSFFEKRLKDRSRLLRITAALVILAFFTFYVSSGMVAAGKFFEASFGWEYLVGMLVVSAVTLTYSLFGGFLGATLTDVSQGLLMFGALIVDPPDLPEVDREYVLVQSEVYLEQGTGQGEEPAAEVDPDAIVAERPAFVTFNGIAGQYGAAGEMFEARVGERVRFWVLVAGPNRPTSFHIVGGQFDTVYAEGAYQLGPEAEGVGAQALGLQPAQGGFVELTFPEAGHYSAVSHIMVDAERGAHGVVRVTD